MIAGRKRNHQCITNYFKGRLGSPTLFVATRTGKPRRRTAHALRARWRRLDRRHGLAAQHAQASSPALGPLFAQGSYLLSGVPLASHGRKVRRKRRAIKATAGQTDK